MKLAGAPVLALAALVLAAPLRAQDSSAVSPITLQAGPSLGVELGFSRASFRGSGASGTRSSNGAVAGAWFRLPLARWLSVQPGLRLVSRGGAGTIPSLAGPVDFEVDLVYLDMPLLLRARLPGISRTNLVLLLGPAPGARIGCNVDFSQAGSPLARATCDQATTGASFRSWDVALTAGVGIALPVERSEISLEARYARGTRDVIEQTATRNEAFTFTLSVPF